MRYRWSEVPWFVEGLGFAGIIASLWVIFRVMKENTFLSRSVEIQAGHKVITTGPYRWVRHPMYSAYIAMMLCFSLALGSWYSLIPGALNASLLVIRAALEDKTLHAELPGYSEYAQTTRYRLLPGVW